MLTIFIGIALFFLICYIGSIIDNDIWVVFIAILVGLSGIVVGLFYPINGYKEEGKLIKTVELISLSNSVASTGHGGLFYVNVNANNVYSYREKVDSSYTTDTATSYELKMVSENVIEVEEKNCTKPELRVYKKKAKMSIWSFAFFASKTENVFYVPEGTISHQVKLE